ncbi:MAG: hypothetical protein ACNS63_12640 [Candidatus Nitrospinota bacterium M3_3B_026]
MRKHLALILVFLLVMTVACGSGGGSSTNTTTQNGGTGGEEGGASTPWVGQWRAVSQDGDALSPDNNCLITYTADTMTWNHCGVCETSGELEVNEKISDTRYDMTMTYTSTTCPTLDGRVYMYTMTFSDNYNTLEENYYQRDGVPHDQTNVWRKVE